MIFIGANPVRAHSSFYLEEYFAFTQTSNMFSKTIVSRAEARCGNVGRNGRRGIRRYWSRRSTGRASGSRTTRTSTRTTPNNDRVAPPSLLLY